MNIIQKVMRFFVNTFLIGFILPILYIIVRLANGTSLFIIFRDIAEFLVAIVSILRENVWGFMASSFLLLGFSVYAGHLRQMRKLGNGMLGIFYASLLIFYPLNLFFFRNAVVTVPFVIGIGVLSSFSLANDIAKVKVEKTEIKNIRIGSLFRSLIVVMTGLLLIGPSLVAMVGPSPPIVPTKYGKQGPYDVHRTSLLQQVNKTILEMVIPEFPNNEWKIFLYVPETTATVPVHIFLHGHGGPDPKYYDNMMRLVSSWGVLGIFVQYPTNFDNKKLDSFVEKYLPYVANETEIVKGNPLRYQIVLDGILQALESLNSSSIPEVNSFLPNGFNLSMLMVVGHSLGGGMVLFIASEMVKRGWGTKKLVLDIEAGWVSTIPTNMTILPDHTLLNVAIYDRDSIVAPCITADLFERIATRDGHKPLPSDQTSLVIVRSDYHGFPRELALHYSPTDLIKGNIYYRAYVGRLQAMADYLVQGNGKEYFMENTDMGEWRDGTPFKPLFRTTDPYGKRGGEPMNPYVQDFTSVYCVNN